MKRSRNIVDRVSSCPDWTSFDELTPRPVNLNLTRGEHVLGVKCGVVSQSFSQRVKKKRGQWLHAVSSSSSLLQPLFFLSFGSMVNTLSYRNCVFSGDNLIKYLQLFSGPDIPIDVNNIDVVEPTPESGEDALGEEGEEGASSNQDRFNWWQRVRQRVRQVHQVQEME